MELQEFLSGLEAMMAAVRQKDISGTPTGIHPFGPGGLFAVSGLENEVISAHLTPMGIDRVIPAYGTTFMNPLFPAITGWESDSSSEPDGVCDDCPGGNMQTCVLTAATGRICRATEEMEINELIERVNRGVMTDLQLLNLANEQVKFQPGNTRDVLKSAVASQMFTVGILVQRVIAKLNWTGNPANNSTNGGYKEYPGLDLQIATGHVDAITGTTCEALDSDIKDFNYSSVDGSDPDIVEWVSSMEFYLRHIADRSGLMPVEWVIAMRPELFHELTAVWPCRYLTNRCEVGGTNLGVINDNVNVQMRDQMRQGNFLWVNGRKVPVITDDGIYEENSQNSGNVNAGEFASDIYFLPLRARGRNVLYYEYKDFGKIGTEITQLQGRQRFWVTDGGKFLWALEDKKWCFKLSVKTEPRLILRTPQLAGRIQNVKYSPLQHLRSPFDDDPYFVKGGVSERSAPSYYSAWNPPS